MVIYWDRLKLLLKKRSIGGWVLWVLAMGWQALSHWQNVEWLGKHVLPKAWPGAMPHPNYVTVGLILGGFVWFTAVLLWPRKKEAAIEGSTREEGPLKPLNAPHVDIIYSLPIIQSAGSFRTCRPEEVAVVNTGDAVAYNVRIQDKESSRYQATFTDIPRLSKGHPEAVGVDIRQKPNGVCYSSLEALLRFEYEDQAPSGFGEIRVPLTVEFSDGAGNLFQTKHEVSYETFLCEAKTYLVEGTKPMQRPSPISQQQKNIPGRSVKNP